VVKSSIFYFGVFMRSILSVIFIFSIFFSGCSSEDTAIEITTKNNTPQQSKSSNYTLKTTDNKIINIELAKNLLFSKQLEGKIVLINFWATWCPPCKKEIPAFVKLVEKYKDKFIVIGVLMEKDKNKNEIDNFIKEYNINFPITKDFDNFKLAKDIDNVQKYPESFLYSKEGIFLKKFIGEVDINTLEAYILN
jgi:thiol-disulfide isomerase/thioredoxin